MTVYIRLLLQLSEQVAPEVERAMRQHYVSVAVHKALLSILAEHRLFLGKRGVMR